MVDSLNLAGLIGAWIAVLIALIALSCLLPACLVYKAGLPQDALDGRKDETTKDSTTNQDKRREDDVLGLARRLTEQSWYSESPETPFNASEDSELNPHSKNFDAKIWARAMLNIHLGDPKACPLRTVGIAFQDLSVYGHGISTDYQKDVLNIWLEAWGFAQKMLRIHRRRIDILRNFEGVVNAGEMLVVLGPPGSGCSTLLKAIAGETNGFIVDPKSYLNYQGISANQMHKDFRGESLYTAELDVHFPMLSVGDTLTFAARARLPRHVPGGVDKPTFAKHIRDVVMAMFGISHTINTRVGNEYVRGVSGGERKRVTIAEATLSGSPLQCWDNSTRGLDSANAIEFCRTLQTQAQINGNTACVAIYQSPQAIYDIFDKVIVLYEGRQIFFGPTTAAQGYFEKMGFQCPARQTTPDFLTSMTSPQERVIREGWENRVPRTPDEFAQRWKTSEERKRLMIEIDMYDKTYSIGGEYLRKFRESRRAQQAKHQCARSPYTVSYAQQVQLCLWRGFQRLKGDPSLMFTLLFGNFLIALITASVFFNLQSDTSSFYQRSALLFFAVMLNAFGSALEILTLYSQRPIVEKHQRYAFYRPSAEAFASVLTDMPYKIGNAIIFNLTLYFMANLRRGPASFFFFLLINFFITLTMSMMFRTIASVSRTRSQALAPAAILILAISIFTGFAIPTRYMLGWSRWISYIDPTAYGFESLMINEFHNRNFTCSSFIPTGGSYNNGIGSNQHACSMVGSTPGSDIVNGDSYINSAFQHDHAHKWRNFAILIEFLIFFMITYLFAAEFVLAKKSKGEVLIFQRGHIPAAIVKNPPDDFEVATGRLAIIEKQMTEDHKPQTIQRQTAIFHWEDVCYDIKIKGTPRKILDRVDGWVKPGTLTALMGMSGAGKTTLLDVLATRVTMGVVTGELLVDGRILQDQSFQRKTGYVQQQDLHLSTSTVREALRFSALLRQPAYISRQEKLAYVEEVIKVLDMDEYADAVVGVFGEEGLNVEQRKRLTIGVELAAKPELLLFLDEPTSGLDSQTSWAILDLLEKLTKNTSQAILCTIHQPSAMLFQRFDRLLFLKSGGQTVYFGDIGENSSTLTSYFERNGAPPCPKDANPAEWMLDVIGDAPGSHTNVDWFDVWRNSPEHTEVKRELRQFKICPSRVVAREKASYREFAAPFWLQMLEVQRRVFQQYWRTPSYVYSKVALCLFSSLLVGFTFFKAPLTEQGLQNQVFAVFLLLTIFGQLVQQIMSQFVTRRALYEVRERPAKTYSWKAFMLSNIIVELPYQALMAVIMYFCWYYPTGMYRNAIPNAVHERGVLMFLLIFMYLIFTSTFAHMLIAATKSAEIGGGIANMMFSLSLLFCGVLATPAVLPRFWIFMYRISPLTYLVSAVLSTGLANTNVTCASNEYFTFDPQPGKTCMEYMHPYIMGAGGYLQDPEAKSNCSFCAISSTNTFLESFNISNSTTWRNFGILWAYVVFNVVMALFLYWFFRVPDKFGKKMGRKGKSS